MSNFSGSKYAVFGLTTCVIALLSLLANLNPPLHGDEPTPAGEDSSPAVETTINFSRDISPILSENCFSCHGFDEASREADLRLDTFAGATGEDGGTAGIVPNDPNASELVARILSDDADMLMPPPDSGRKLSAKQVQLLTTWVSQGAQYSKHWSFTPPERLMPPKVKGVEHPIDRFIVSRLAQEKKSPTQRADSHTLIRRLSLDLSGLPPSVAEIEQFEIDAAADFDAAYSQLVDKLLASPHYGERWGRWWLDQARYADSNGYSIDGPRQIWSYRDWVVNALNNDMPFDQFTVEQLAGDLLPDPTQQQKIATGFHRNTQINQEGGIDREQFRVDSVFDRVATTGTVWLGLSVGCAQCHDHKFDPISQVEYYRMFAFLNDQDEPSMKVYGPNVDVELLKQDFERAKSQLQDMVDQSENVDAVSAWAEGIDAKEKEKLGKRTAQALDKKPSDRTLDHKRSLFKAAGDAIDEKTREEFERLEKQFNDADAKLNRTATTLVMKERDEPRKTMLLIKGDFTRPDKEVSPGTLSVLHPFEISSDRANRMDLARWIVSPENPLTARVIVNRIWLHYFGRGIVESENDFGLQGSVPTHPELLDWLANRFVDGGWSMKDMHRLIVTSHTYQQSSVNHDERFDPGNYYLTRQQRLRLDAEIVRDVALSASALLAPDLGGPPVYPPIPDGVMGQGQVKRGWNTSKGKDRYRRGLYTFKFRATPPPSLNVFDAPDGLSTCTRRNRSNTPLQALTLMNDPAFFEFATSLEKVIKRDGLITAFRRCTSRTPTEEELNVLIKMDTLNAARTLLNLDETITRE
ncbi:PSD1 and planctomycete cytochrome C domain-containing protein [Planctomycetes bacterium K23_9]|uniref:Planctomycete cytochrome C n=1 Tax=Stieleria marina TaxID=1930275 RepID=A0A517NYQ2_9BACT|nr:Planctomycete cytochrome C [Planctomycetes bacterium K23_9]